MSIFIDKAGKEWYNFDINCQADSFLENNMALISWNNFLAGFLASYAD